MKNLLEISIRLGVTKEVFSPVVNPYIPKVIGALTFVFDFQLLKAFYRVFLLCPTVQNILG